jgi:hypothetical protein
LRVVVPDKPVGSAYNIVYGETLRRYKLDQIDKGVRSRLAALMANIGEVEAFLSALDLTQRLSYNHPNYRAWKRGTTAPPAQRKATDTVRIRELTQALANAHAHIRELEKAWSERATYRRISPEVITSRPDKENVFTPPAED